MRQAFMELPRLSPLLLLFILPAALTVFGVWMATKASNLTHVFMALTAVLLFWVATIQLYQFWSIR
jgi:hypothetical protein